MPVVIESVARVAIDSSSRRVMRAINFNPKSTLLKVQRQSVATFIAILQDFFHFHRLGRHHELPEQMNEWKVLLGDIELALVIDFETSMEVSAP
jgi:hypothetical protein